MRKVTLNFIVHYVQKDRRKVVGNSGFKTQLITKLAVLEHLD